LRRVVRQADGTLVPGRTLPGRGAWLCQALQPCLDLAARRGGFDRAFRTRVTPAQIEALRQLIREEAPDRGVHFVPGTPAARD